jgi:hypothetical protein
VFDDDDLLVVISVPSVIAVHPHFGARAMVVTAGLDHGRFGAYDEGMAAIK